LSLMPSVVEGCLNTLAEKFEISRLRSLDMTKRTNQC
jgi:hypothetical protein